MTHAGMNFAELAQALSIKEAAVLYLQNVGILHTHRHCLNGHVMKLSLSEREDRWRCTKTRCKEQRQLKAGTWLQGTHLTYRSACLFIYSWAHELSSIKFCRRELDIISTETIFDWNNFLREVCDAKLLQNQAYIGGPSTHVELDESLFVRRKYNVGHAVNQQWVLGGICRETKECFLYTVPDRSEAILRPIIEESIRPYTTIITDCWSAYHNISSIPGRNYKHLMVNHSQNFVDPVSGACTNAVESMWGKAKARNKKQWGTHRSMLDSYLCEYMWRKRFGGDDPYAAIIGDIAALFPPI
jgi:hypothetical protein